MAHFYAHPHTLVLQQKQLPHGFPEDQPTYEQSGWCTFESACAKLSVEGGGRFVEFVRDKESQRVHAQRTTISAEERKTPEEMKAVFLDEAATKFQGKAVREEVSAMYENFHRFVLAYDEKRKPLVVKFAELNYAAVRSRAGMPLRKMILLLVIFGLPGGLFALLYTKTCAGPTQAALPAAMYLGASILVVLFMPARSVRANLWRCISQGNPRAVGATSRVHPEQDRPSTTGAVLERAAFTSSSSS